LIAFTQILSKISAIIKGNQMKMSLSFKLILTMLLSLTMLVSIPQDSFSAKKKYKKRKTSKFNPQRTKDQALEIIRCNSLEVSSLAGLEPIESDSANILLDDSEILDDGDELTVANVETQSIEGDEGEDLEELEEGDDVQIDINDFNMLWLTYVAGDEVDEYTDFGIKKSEFMGIILDWLGTPYRFGGTSSKAIDCSAFTRTIFSESSEIELPRTAQMQYGVGIKINRKDLKFGDLVFFNTRRYAYATHVGIYLGDNLFAHASSRYGVTVSSLESNYYDKRFIGGRRLDYKVIQKIAKVQKNLNEQAN